MSRNAILSLYNRRPQKVETQDFASPEEEYARKNGGDMLMICVSFVCETQNLASHKEEYARSNGVNVLAMSALFACETQNFASLLG